MEGERTKILSDSLHSAQERWEKELQAFEEERKNITKVVHMQIESALKNQNNKIINTINPFIEKIAEMFYDRETLKRLEVIRSKTYFQLGDQEEKIRSLQYIGFLGNSGDIEFLDKVVTDSQQSDKVRFIAQKAKAIIQQRGV